MIAPGQDQAPALLPRNRGASTIPVEGDRVGSHSRTFPWEFSKTYFLMKLKLAAHVTKPRSSLQNMVIFNKVTIAALC